MCLEEKLVIEVDGGYHSQPQQKMLDKQRSEHLEAMGFTVIRFDNDKIMEEIDKVLKEICRYIF
ncbi:MAG: endonuclease domain-containing protein [Bacteroidaceae bacterium]|nr:endonuclease domain-containing protein [Bacteroidaceae bacterium]